MDEDLSLYTTEIPIELPKDEGIESSDVIENINNDPLEDEASEGIDGTTVEEIEIDIEETIGWSGSDGTSHYGLYDRNEPDQHEISSITGLREELDDIRSIKTVYSDKFNAANYYRWENGNIYDTYGYFVSIVPGTTEIKFCDGADIFGVSVDNAGFVGGQDVLTNRDGHYGLIVTSGIVNVRCNSGVEVGNYIVSDAYGRAKKSNSNYGYKVLGIKDIDGVEYAVISLDVQADVVKMLGDNLNEVKEQAEANYRNIFSATNAANQALNKVQNIEASNQAITDKVNAAVDKVDGVNAEVESLSNRVSGYNELAIKSNEIANRAIESAISMQEEAMAEVSKALQETKEVRNGFNDTINQVQNDIDKVLEDVGEVSGEFAEIVRKVNANTTQIGLITGFKPGDDVEGVTGVVATVSEHAALLEGFAQWKETVNKGEIDSIALVKQIADKNKGQLDLIAQHRDEDLLTIAGISETATGNESKIEGLTAWQGVANSAMARIEQKADENGAYIHSTVSNMDKHSVGPHSQAYGFTLEQAAAWLEEGMIYVPTEDVTEEYKLANEAVEWTDENKDITKVYYTVTGEGDEQTKSYWYFDYDETNDKYDWISDDEIPTLTRTFTPTYLYMWGRAGGDGPYRWITVDKYYKETDKINISTPAVFFVTDSIPSVLDDEKMGYWYTNGNTTGDASDYEPYTLYKWTSYKKINLDGTDVKDDEDNFVFEDKWFPVATLAGNSKNMVVSQIRQDANSIETRVMNAEGSIASSRQWITGNSAHVEDWVEWKSANATSIANFMATAEDNFARAEQVASVVDDDGNIKAASIIAAVNDDTSGVTIEADHLQFSGSSFELAIGQIVDASIDNIELGGRNLLKDSNVMYECTNKSDYGKSGSFNLVTGYDLQSLIGKTLTFSYFVHCPGEKDINTDISFGERFGMHGNIQWKNDSGATTYTYPFATYLIPPHTNSRVNMTATLIPPQGYDSIVSITISYQPHAKPAAENNEVWKIGYPKLELGSMATDWTPAVEDMVEKKGVIASINDSDEVELKIRGDKVEIEGNTIFKSLTGTTEDGQTFIDGGKIKTGTLDASKITTGELGANVVYAGRIETSQIVAGELSADVIYTGTLDASQITAGELGANVVYAGTIDASQITTGELDADLIDADSLSAITADLGDVTAGTLQNKGYDPSDPDSKGIKIDLNEGTIDSPYFKVDKEGLTTVDKGDIGGWTLNGKMLTADDNSENNNLGYKVGLYSGSDYLEDSLLGVGVKSPIRFFCGSLDEDKKDLTTCTFCVLADGSLFANAALFFSENVKFDDSVKFGGGGQTVGSMVDNINRIPGNISQLYNDLGFVTRSQVQQMIDDALNNSSNDPTPSDPTPSVIWRPLAGLNGTVYDPEVEEGEDASFTVECPSDNSSVLRIKTNAPFNTIKITLASSNIMQGINCSVQSDTKSYEYDFEPNVSNRTITLKIQNNWHDDDYANTEFYVELLKNNGYFTVNWIYGVELSYDYNVNTTQND